MSGFDSLHGDERPWIRGNRNHYRKYYEQALALTPWAGEEREKGKEGVYAGLSLMDYVTVICPPIRRDDQQGAGNEGDRGAERNILE